MKKSQLCVASLCALAAVHAQAQSGPTNPSDSEDTLQEVIVTAEKRSEDVQKTAISIETVGQQQVEQRGLTSLDETLKQVSGVVIESSSQAGAGAQIFIRGIGSNFLDPTISAQPAVAVNVDGVINTSPTAVTSSMFDVDHVEVLRGPQGTMYGSSAEAGVVNVVLSQPSNMFELKGREQVGNYNARQIEQMINIPVGDQLAFRLTVSNNKRDGYIQGPGAWESPLGCPAAVTILNDTLACKSGPGGANTVPVVFLANNYGSVDDTDYRGKVRWNPTDWFTITGLIERTNNHDTGSTFVNYSDFIGGHPLYGNPVAPTVAYHAVEQTPSTVDTFSANAQFSLGQYVNLTLIPSHTKTVSAPPPGTPGSPSDVKQDTYEARLSSSDKTPIKWTAGFYYDKNSLGISMPTTVTASPTDGSYGVFDLARPFKNENVFGQVTYPVTDAFRVTAGGRYSHDQSGYNYALYKTSGTDASGNPIVTYESGIYTEHASFNDTSYKFGVEYDIAAQSMVYAEVSSGYKAGGLSLRDNSASAAPVLTPADVVLVPYQPETSVSWEIGSKNRFFHDTLQVNGDIFFTHWKNMQLGSFACAPGTGYAACIASGGVLSGTSTDLVPLVVNAQTSSEYGLELDATWLFTSADQVSMSTTFLHGTYGTLVENSFGTPYVLTGHTMANTPTAAGNVSYQHTFRLPRDMSFTPRVQEQFSTHYVNTQEYWLQGSSVPGYGKTDVTLSLSAGKWSVNAYGRNLFNKLEAQIAHPLGIIPSEPRVWGANVVWTY